jgi:hypothetical protein
MSKPILPSSLEVWSCDPKDIPPWTEEGKARLHAFLAEVFGWEKVDSPTAGTPSEVENT